VYCEKVSIASIFIFLTSNASLFIITPSSGSSKRIKNLVEKEMKGESLHRELSLKSPGVIAEEIFVKVDRHGNARYSIDWC